MSDSATEPFTDDWIISERPSKIPLDPWRPYAYFVEPERTRQGAVENVAAIFLTNRECPFRCLICDLWKNTTDTRVPDGAIPGQIEWALARLPTAQHVKLYNSGNFFDAQAIPPRDLPAIAAIVAPFKSVIVECHPLLVDRRCVEFRELLRPTLEVAMGLETIHPDVLPRLNKRMTLADFERAVHFLRQHAIEVRAFVLLRPPFLSESEGVCWAQRSIEYAFDLGVECCTVIPTRAGNGAMERLQEQGLFNPPRLESMEQVLEFGIRHKRGRVFVDLWDIARLFSCHDCSLSRARRLHEMNLTQCIAPSIFCECLNR
jgi:archaeosine synthase beta-subunit